MSKSSIALSSPVYNYILDQIMTKELVPGDRIPETKIAKEFNISRTPVREAMRQLANDGLLEIFPNRYAQVKEYTKEEKIEIGVLRIALDTMAIKLSAFLGSQADFIKLQELAKECDDAHLKGDRVRRYQADCDFHSELANISKNQLLIKYQRELYLRVQYIQICYQDRDTNDELHIRQHFQIVDALINNDVNTALEIMIDHLTSFYDIKELYPEDFFAWPSIPLHAKHLQ